MHLPGLGFAAGCSAPLAMCDRALGLYPSFLDRRPGWQPCIVHFRNAPSSIPVCGHSFFISGMLQADPETSGVVARAQAHPPTTAAAHWVLPMRPLVSHSAAVAMNLLQTRPLHLSSRQDSLHLLQNTAHISIHRQQSSATQRLSMVMPDL
jgi:hypothetical protein